MVGFNLRPLWDAAIPIESFLGDELAQNFRSYLERATQDGQERARSCLEENGQNCTELGGVCVSGMSLRYLAPLVRSSCMKNLLALVSIFWQTYKIKRRVCMISPAKSSKIQLV